MNQIYLAIETLVSSSISRSVSWCDFQLTVSNAPNLTSELFFSKPKDIIYCKGFFLIENLTVSLSPDSLFNAPLFFFFTFICIYFLRYLFPGHKFLFLQFLLGYLYLLYNLLFWFLILVKNPFVICDILCFPKEKF